MKPYNKMTKMDAGKMLFTLFADVLPIFLSHMRKLNDELNDNKQTLESSWQSDIEFSAWNNLAHITTQSIDHHLKHDLSHASLIRQLFGGYAWIWTEHCLFDYAMQKDCPEAFRKAIDLFFGQQAISMEVLRERQNQLKRTVAHYMFARAESIKQQISDTVIEINTANQNLKIGVPENEIDGQFEITRIKIDQQHLFVQLNSAAYYYPISDLLANHLRIEDQLAIIEVLEAFLSADEPENI